MIVQTFLKCWKQLLVKAFGFIFPRIPIKNEYKQAGAELGQAQYKIG